MSKSIRYYYFTTIAAVLVISVMVMGLIQMALGVNYFQRDKQKQLRQVVTAVNEGLLTGRIDLTGESRYTIDLMAGMAEAEVYLADPAGNIIFTTEKSNALLGMQVPARVMEVLARTEGYNETGVLGGMFPRNFYTVAVPLRGEAGLGGYLFASADASSLKVYLMDMASTFVLSAGLVMMVASLLAVVLTKRTVIPIRRVSEAARQFAEGNYSARVPVEGDDELARLSITFNEMANSFESTDRTRRSFMGNIAHELRTPMTTIKGFIDGMLDGTIPEDQRGKYLHIVSEEVGRLARLTRNMLDLSKLEAGEYQPAFSQFDLWKPAASVFLSAEQRLGEKQLEVQGLEPGKPILVEADEDFVHQVLFNLLDNAIKFTAPGGKITLSLTSARGMATLSLQNSGEGIPEDVLPYIFDRFYKGDQSRNDTAGGSGLGLNICKVLLSLMGGRIWAESEPGEWARFSFSLPLAKTRKQGDG